MPTEENRSALATVQLYPLLTQECLSPFLVPCNTGEKVRSADVFRTDGRGGRGPVHPPLSPRRYSCQRHGRWRDNTALPGGCPHVTVTSCVKFREVCIVDSCQVRSCITGLVCLRLQLSSVYHRRASVSVSAAAAVSGAEALRPSLRHRCWRWGRCVGRCRWRPGVPALVYRAGMWPDMPAGRWNGKWLLLTRR